MGTFIKCFGAAGGYIAGSKVVIDKLRLRGYSGLYAEAMSPPVLTQIIASEHHGHIGVPPVCGFNDTHCWMVAVAAVALLTTISHLAVGLGDGTVHLYRNVNQSPFSGFGSFTAIPQPLTIRKSATEPITGFGCREPTEDVLNTYLFVVSTNRVLSYQASGQGRWESPYCGGCSAVAMADQHDILLSDVQRDGVAAIAGLFGRGVLNWKCLLH